MVFPNFIGKAVIRNFSDNAKAVIRNFSDSY
jgi:hypothetical protein